MVDHTSGRQRIPSTQPDIQLDEPEDVVFEEEAKPKPKRDPLLADERLWPSMLIFVRAIGITFVAGLLMATVFSYWTPEDDFLPDRFRSQMQVVRVTQAPLPQVRTPIPTEAPVERIGIIAGHSGPPKDPSFDVDPGAVCDDNNDGVPELTELEINLEVAQKAANQLLSKGYEVDILEEFDPRLMNYRAKVLVSIHANDCQNYGFGATGFAVAGPFDRGTLGGADEALVRCLVSEYEVATGLNRHFGQTRDMTLYHTFGEVSVDTPVAIIETGFMFADRQILTQNRDAIANGIVAGILCFLEPPSYLE